MKYRNREIEVKMNQRIVGAGSGREGESWSKASLIDCGNNKKKLKEEI